MSPKPFSQACENNKQPILEVICNFFTEPTTVLEIGSGTGQHVCYLAQQLPHVTWQPSDQFENLAGIQQWVDDTQLSNVLPPIELGVNSKSWPVTRIEGLFTANTLHIMAWLEIESLFEQLKTLMLPRGLCCIYGPFNYAGNYTSESNAQFDQWLRTRNPLSGIRDFDSIMQLAHSANLALVDDFTMPANNRLLVLRNRRQS